MSEHTGIDQILSLFGSMEAEIDPSEKKTTKTAYKDGTLREHTVVHVVYRCTSDSVRLWVDRGRNRPVGKQNHEDHLYRWDTLSDHTVVHLRLSVFGSMEAEIYPSENRTTKTACKGGTH